jgi:hypothetical protein
VEKHIWQNVFFRINKNLKWNLKTILQLVVLYRPEWVP